MALPAWPAARLLLFGALAGLGPAACAGDEAGRVELAGETMGTRWAVTLLAPPAAPAGSGWRAEVERVLARVDAEMSTWREDSELSRFNAARRAGWFPVSHETAGVVAEALAVHRRTDGAFDPTLGPLVELWGFAAHPPRSLPPAAAALSRARRRVGAGAVEVRSEPPALRKHVADLELDLSAIAKGFGAERFLVEIGGELRCGGPGPHGGVWRVADLELDLSAIAKGFGVDAVAERLATLGAERFLVEIGGELRCGGPGPHGGVWRVAIERPLPDARDWQRVLAIRDVSVATSGTYRNFVEVAGERFSHLLDPRSGVPVRHDVVSVSVVAARASLADAFATGLLVLGPEAGLRVAAREGVAAFFVALRGGRLIESHSPAFAPYLGGGPQASLGGRSETSP